MVDERSWCTDSCCWRRRNAKRSSLVSALIEEESPSELVEFDMLVSQCRKISSGEQHEWGWFVEEEERLME